MDTNGGYVARTTDSGGRFEPVPLLALPPGELTAGRLEPALRRWVSSAPVRALAEASGWEWPSCPDTGELLERLAGLSGDWDFRGRDGGVERNLIGTRPAEVNGRVVSEELIASAAYALGLVSATPVPAGPFSALVVLCGLVRACVNRTRHAATLLHDGVDAASVAVLSGHRKLGGDEPGLASKLGFGASFDEAEVVVAATRRAFGLGEPQRSRESGPSRSDWDDELWSAGAQYTWPGVEVLIVPSSTPHRRANTMDQLRYWADHSGIGRDDRVLLLTTQIYVPFQLLVGTQVLGIERGCGVYCCGVDAASSFLPPKPFSGRSYLQEIRSTLLASSELLARVRKADG
jgi:hypothetical protein